ncbi:hypothetical protein D8S78_18945 [Natrialba swarupiae]|nr:hypothetical protein [Natrialba swarupiae]
MARRCTRRGDRRPACDAPRESAAGEPFTIFVHHPIHYYDVSNSYWWSTYPERAFCGNKSG